MKVGSEIRVFHDLHAHLNREIVFTLRNDRISAMSSLGMNTDGNSALSGH